MPCRQGNHFQVMKAWTEGLTILQCGIGLLGGTLLGILDVLPRSAGKGLVGLKAHWSQRHVSMQAVLHYSRLVGKIGNIILLRLMWEG